MVILLCLTTLSNISNHETMWCYYCVLQPCLTSVTMRQCGVIIVSYNLVSLYFNCMYSLCYCVYYAVHSEWYFVLCVVLCSPFWYRHYVFHWCFEYCIVHSKWCLVFYWPGISTAQLILNGILCVTGVVLFIVLSILSDILCFTGVNWL